MRYINYLPRIILITALIICGNAYARMYQWTNADTGTTQLSGKPPSWYRGESGGPRVFVFENGRLIDDTAVAVTDEVRQRMRQQAFLLAEEDRQKAQENLARSKALKEKFQDKEEKIVAPELPEDVPVIVDAEIEFAPEQQDEHIAGETEEQMEELKKIITDWEKQQSESAKANAEKVLQ